MLLKLDNTRLGLAAPVATSVANPSTKKHDAHKVLQLEREKSHLTMQLVELEAELDALSKLDLQILAFKGWVHMTAHKDLT